MTVSSNPLLLQGGQDQPVTVTPMRVTGRQRLNTPGDSNPTRARSIVGFRHRAAPPRATPERRPVLSPPRLVLNPRSPTRFIGDVQYALLEDDPMDVESHNFGNTQNRMTKYGSYIRRYGATRNPDSVWAHLNVYNNPFSDATQIPKIPDGKCVSSTGLSNSASYEHTVNATTTTIVLFPGLESNAYVHWNDGTNDNYKVMTLTHKQALSMVGTDNIEVTQQDSTQIHRWRRVSNGIRISLTNNAENNDGWFEACRIGTTSDANDWLVARAGTIETTAYAMFPSTPKDITSEEMQRLPSYVMGDLRDIKHVIFPLRPEGNEHDLVNLRDYYSSPGMVTEANAQAFNAGLSQAAQSNYTELQRFNSDGLNNHDLVKSTSDFGWDTVVIRIYGRAEADNNPSKLVLTVAQNDELVYHERSIMSQFMTKSPMMHGFKVNNGPQKAHAPLVERRSAPNQGAGRRRTRRIIRRAPRRAPMRRRRRVIRRAPLRRRVYRRRR